MALDDKDYDQSWEKAYGKGEQLNRYPYDMIVSIVIRLFKSIKDKKTIKVLDLGCGAGNNSAFLAKEGFTITGIDASKSAIQYVTERFNAENLDGEFHVLDFSKLDQLNSKFDLVIDRQSLSTQSFANAKKIARAINSLLNTNGLFLSMFYNIDHPGFSECLKHASRQENNTFLFPDKPSVNFSGARRITLLDTKLHEELYKDFQIVEMYNHIVKSIKGNSFSEMGEYISLLKKC
jgi:SAM-dependent methyltransferase